MYHQPRHYSHHVPSSTRPSIKLSGQPKDSTSGLVSNEQCWIYEVPHRTITATNIVAENWYYRNINLSTYNISVCRYIESNWTYHSVIWFYHHAVSTASLCSICRTMIALLGIWDQNKTRCCSKVQLHHPSPHFCVNIRVLLRRIPEKSSPPSFLKPPR